MESPNGNGCEAARVVNHRGGTGPANQRRRQQPSINQRAAAVTSQRRPSYGAGGRKAQENGTLDYVHHVTSNRQSRQHHKQHFWDAHHSTSSEWWRGGGTSQSKFSATHNKQRYLLATCQFVVDDTVDLDVHARDPDLIVEWEKVEELRVRGALPSCPICLDPPVAAKMTPCGHVYCWSCVLHYLALGDKLWRKCPICYESVYAKDLKSVVGCPASQQAIGEQVTLCLMKRGRRSTDVQRVEEGDVDEVYAKFIMATADYVIDTMLKREQTELETKYLHDKDEPEVIFVEQAMKYLAIRREEMYKKVALCKMNSGDLTQKKENVRPGLLCDNQTNATVTSDSVFQPGSSPRQLKISPRTRVSSEDDGEEWVYFYQGMDGDYTYMCPLNARQLITEYGSLQQAPLRVTGTVTYVSTDTVTNTTRDKSRYLAHLPLGATYTLTELDMLPGVLIVSTVNMFKDEFARRRHARLRQSKEETRRARLAEQWNEAMLHKPIGTAIVDRQRTPSPIAFTSRVNSAQDEMTLSWVTRPSPEAVNVLAEEWSPALGESMSTTQRITPPGETTQQMSVSPPSFAQMLRNRPSSSSMGGQSASGETSTPPSVASFADLIIAPRQKQIKKKGKKNKITTESED